MSDEYVAPKLEARDGPETGMAGRCPLCDTPCMFCVRIKGLDAGPTAADREDPTNPESRESLPAVGPPHDGTEMLTHRNMATRGGFPAADRSVQVSEPRDEACAWCGHDKRRHLRGQGFCGVCGYDWCPAFNPSAMPTGSLHVDSHSSRSVSRQANGPSEDDLWSAIDHLWGELPIETIKDIEREIPDLVALCQHAHHRTHHEQHMVHVPSWGSNPPSDTHSHEPWFDLGLMPGDVPSMVGWVERRLREVPDGASVKLTLSWSPADSAPTDGEAR